MQSLSADLLDGARLIFLFACILPRSHSTAPLGTGKATYPTKPAASSRSILVDLLADRCQACHVLQALAKDVDCTSISGFGVADVNVLSHQIHSSCKHGV